MSDALLDEDNSWTLEDGVIWPDGAADARPRAVIAREGLGYGAKIRIVVLGLVAADAAAVMLAVWLATYLRYGQLYPKLTPGLRPELFYPLLSLMVGAVCLGIFYSARLYDFDAVFWGSGEFTRLVRSVALGMMVVILATYAARIQRIPRGWILLAWVLVTVFVVAGRLFFRWSVRALRSSGRLCGRTLIVGDNAEARDLLRRVAGCRESGLEAVGYVAGSSGALDAEGLPNLGHPAETRQIAVCHAIDTLLVASSAFTHRQVGDILQKVRGLGIDVHIPSGLFDVLAPRVFIKEIAGVPITTVRGVPLTRFNLIVKRIFDLIIAGALLAVLSPLWIAIGALIKLGSPGPVLYGQERIGQDGVPFRMHKFRSMIADADDRLREVSHLNEARGLHFKIRDDPRVTGVGRWMRKFSIDELPQLLNVMLGQMSLVGPRPPLPKEAAGYSDWHRRRLEVPPGMTGLWQTSGRSDLSFEDAVRLDIYYIENWSVRLDLLMLLRTIPVVLFPKGAY